MTSAPNSLNSARATRPISIATARSHDATVRFTRISAPTLAASLVLAAFGMAMIAPAAARDFCISCSEPDAIYNCQVETGFTRPAEAAAKLHCIKELARRGAHRSCSVSRNSETLPCGGEPVVLAPPAATPAGPGDAPAILPAGTPPNALPSGRPTEVIGSHGEQDYRFAPARVEPQERPQTEPHVEEPRKQPGDLRDAEPLDATQQSAPAHTTEEAAAEEPKKRPNKPPKTVEELAIRAAEDSQKGLQKAGELVTDTAKSTGKGIENAGKAVGNAAKKTWECVTSLFSKC